MLIYIIYFILIAVLAVEYEFQPFDNKIPIVVISILLIALAGFRSPEVARDYESYQLNFELIQNLDDPIFLTILEPGFIAIVYTIQLLSAENYAMLIMLFFAFASVSIKVGSISKLAINPYLVILFYFAHFFILHEMTQIRIGLASGVFLAAIPFFLKDNRPAFIGMILLACLFHYSAIFYLGVLLFDIRTFNKYLYMAAMALTMVLAVVRLPLTNLLSKFDSASVSVKLETYVEMGQRGLLEDVNVFNSITILNFLCCSFFLIFIPKNFLLADKRLLLFLKCNILSIFLLSLLSGVPSVAFRFSELFGVASMFLFAYLAKYLPFSKVNILIVVLLAALIFYIVGFYGGGLLNEYKIVSIK